MGNSPAGYSRREVLQLSTSVAIASVAIGTAAEGAAATKAPTPTGAPAEGVMPGSGTGGQPAQLLLLQTPWSLQSVDEVLPAIRSVRDEAAAQTLVLLPPDEARGAIPTEAAASQKLGAAAHELRLHLAGAAVVRTAEGIQTIGFVFDPDGQQILRTPKHTPDFLHGFTDTTAATGKPGTFPVAATPFGRLGMLIGEDILYGTQVRALFFNGAEIILNPAIEISDPALALRRKLPQALCVENNLYIAVATPSRRTVAGYEQRLPTRTGLTDWTGTVVAAEGDETAVVATLDVEGLRATRVLWPEKVVTGRNGQTLVRDALYAPQFHALAAARAPLSAPTSRQAWRAEAERRIEAQRTAPGAAREEVYQALLVQVAERTSVRAAPERKAEIARIVKENLALVARSAAQEASRLVIFPEFGFSGAGWRTIDDIRSVALRFPGPELDPISAFAQRHKVYVVFEQLELDDHFPGHVFNTVFLVNDSGDLILKHRKLQCADVLGTLPDTTPGSVFDRYVQVYGLDYLIGVADTPLGKIGLTICYENMFPEVTQLLVQKGAEIITHSTSEGHGGNPGYGWDTARQHMAFMGTAYLLSVDNGDVSGAAFAASWRPAGRSQVIDYNGRFLSLIQPGVPGILTAHLDIGALRQARKDPRCNLAVWDDPRIYAAAYAQGKGVPNNLWRDPDDSPYHNQRAAMAVYEDFYSKGVYVRGTRPLHGAKGDGTKT